MSQLLQVKYSIQQCKVNFSKGTLNQNLINEFSPAVREKIEEERKTGNLFYIYIIFYRFDMRI